MQITKDFWQQLTRKFENTISLVSEKVHDILENDIKPGLDDSKYRKLFNNTVGQHIYHIHLDDYYICCTFCSKLTKSSCHEYCFKCSNSTYTDCSLLLPGTFSFSDSHFGALGDSFTPWIFRTPCTSFERLTGDSYFKNFISSIPSVTLANYEALEGLFLGLSRGKRPCHICASVNLDIFNKCSKEEKNDLSHPCDKIINEISRKYKVITGMIRYIE